MNRGTIQTRFMKPSRQKSCDGRRGEELALLASLRPLLAHARLPADGIGQGENLGRGRWSHGFIRTVSRALSMEEKDWAGTGGLRAGKVNRIDLTPFSDPFSDAF